MEPIRRRTTEDAESMGVLRREVRGMAGMEKEREKRMGMGLRMEMERERWAIGGEKEMEEGR